MNKILFLLLLLEILPARLFSEEVVVRTADPPGDQTARFRPGRPHPGGDIRGAELTLKKLPGDPSPDGRGEYLYLPVSLKLDLDRTLRGGEVQLCVFIHLPPFYIEHLVSRDSFIDSRTGERILLDSQRELSFLLERDQEKEQRISEFKKSGLYRDCFFFSPPEKRDYAFRRGERFNVHSGDTYIFPASSSLFWKEVPRLRVSASLTVMRRENLKMGDIKDVYQDSLTSSWTSPTSP